jgi:hypothetical protein
MFLRLRQKRINFLIHKFVFTKLKKKTLTFNAILSFD